MRGITLICLICLLSFAHSLFSEKNLETSFQCPRSVSSDLLRFEEDAKMCGEYKTKCINEDSMSFAKSAVFYGTPKEFPSSVMVKIVEFRENNCLDSYIDDGYGFKGHSVDTGNGNVGILVEEAYFMTSTIVFSCTPEIEANTWYTVSDHVCRIGDVDPLVPLRRMIGNVKSLNVTFSKDSMEMCDKYDRVSDLGCLMPTTAVPSGKPTEVPTEKPTEEPTQKPTKVPTEAPTEAPTEVPTEVPTEKPGSYLGLWIIVGSVIVVLLIVLFVCCFSKEEKEEKEPLQSMASCVC